MENSPFNKLPGELRNQIYELVLVDHQGPVDIRQKDWSEPDRGWSYVCRNLALTRTCKKSRQEALPIFFSQPFRFTAPDENPLKLGYLDRTIRLWLSYIGESAKHIRAVEVNLGRYSSDGVIYHEDLESEVTEYMKAIKTVFRRYSEIQNVFKLGFQWPGKSINGIWNFHSIGDPFDLQLYPTSFAEVKASLDAEYRKVQLHAKDCGEHGFWDSHADDLREEIGLYLKELEEDRTWVWVNGENMKESSPVATIESPEQRCSCLDRDWNQLADDSKVETSGA